jgi:hypothetical protein
MENWIERYGKMRMSLEDREEEKEAKSLKT